VIKDSIIMRQKRVRRKMVCSIALQVLGFGVMFVGGVGIVAEGANNAWSLGLLFAVALIVVGIVMFVAGLEIQPYKDWVWEKDREGDLLRKELKALGGKG